MAPSKDNLCGFSWCGYPNFLQKYATTRTYIIVYGILGTFQAMGYVYFAITLQTIEKRFKIPSQTTGLILSGNEVSQILLSVFLAYFGGQRNRPRFIAWGVIFCALSCFILALPHFIYGAGEDALKLTKEYIDSTKDLSVIIDNSTVLQFFRQNNQLCLAQEAKQDCNQDIESIVPLVLIFLSQFVLGVGNTLYYALGQTYLDDNTKKTNTPMLLSYAFALRTLGPIIGFVLGYVSLKIYIDPFVTPLIDSQDPRWLGAWWFGWVFLGFAMIIVAGLIGLFPKELPKKRNGTAAMADNVDDNIPKVMKSEYDLFSEEQRPLRNNLPDVQQVSGSMMDIPTMKDFPSAIMRLLKNKILMCNIFSGIFYILGAAGYFTFMSKYLEVQFHKSAADATIITGPFTIFGVVVGFLASGHYISKKKPAPSKLLMWNVIVGIFFMIGEVSYLFLTCPDGNNLIVENGQLNLSSSCNSDCHCIGVPYTPVCNEETGDTYFSPCHAGCNAWTKEERFYSECECVRSDFIAPVTSSLSMLTTLPSSIQTHSPTIGEYSSTSKVSTTLAATTSSPATTTTLPATSTSSPATTAASTTTPVLSTDAVIVKNNLIEINKNTSAPDVLIRDEQIDQDYEYENDYELVETEESATKDKVRRSTDEKIWGKMTPGACMKGCAAGFFTFAIVSSVINCFGASGRIGNLLVNYRCVSTQDKSITQGLALMLVSLFALIPGPILYGRLIDSTCLVWTEKCSGSRGNCQLYDQRAFRYIINLTALSLTTIGVFFDVLVWKFGKNLDLYGEREAIVLQQKSRNGYNNQNHS
ncbi:unnamed protein product [Diamesa tonsa]